MTEGNPNQTTRRGSVPSGKEEMERVLARNTGALLMQLASDCDRVQVILGALLRPVGPTYQAIEPGSDLLRDLQDLDRIAQVLRDIAAVQHALSDAQSVQDGCGPAQAAKLEETRAALMCDPRPDTEQATRRPKLDNGVECQFF